MHFTRFLPRAISGLLLALPLACCADSRAPLFADLPHAAWSRLQGAPADILKIAQTSDGGIWLAAPTGLYRFDGARFERVERVYGHRLVSNNVVDLMADPQQGLWVGYRSGSVTLFRTGESRTYHEPERPAAAAALCVPPGMVGSIWFKLSMLASVTGVCYSLHRLRLRTLTQRMQGRLAERARIARTLHDTLLQGIQGVILSFRAHAELIPAGSVERAHIDYTLKSAEQLLVQGRNEIVGLRTKSAEDCLYHALVEFGNSTTAGRKHKFVSELQGRPRLLNDATYDHAYAIGREVLCNAARYSNASRLTLKISYSSGGLKIEIHDDGCGLTYQEYGSELNGGWGIRGIQERASSIGAMLQISSSHQGTTVLLFVKAKAAFVTEEILHFPHRPADVFRGTAASFRRYFHSIRIRKE
jgi:signal transduction histidine kinase